MGSLKKIACIFAILAVVSTGGVCASWSYAEDFSTGEESAFGVDLKEFYYNSDVLPSDDDLNKNHQGLTITIVDYMNGAGGGLFGNMLPQAIQKRKNKGFKTYGSMEGDSVSGYILNASQAYEVEFLFYFVQDDLYYLFTYDADDRVSAGKTIPVYKTILKIENGTWKTFGSAQGEADGAYYEGSENRKTTINPDSWRRT